jgi:DNA polymerase V
MVKIRSYEDFQTVPVVDMDEMTPYLQVEASDGKSFPLPGEEYNFIRLDLSLALIRHPAHTFFLRVSQETLGSEGFLPGYIAVVDRQATPRHRDIIVAYFEGSFIVCRLHMQEEEISIQTDEETVLLEPDMEFAIWGVVKDMLIPR